jgi:HK97 family phage portal protein
VASVLLDAFRELRNATKVATSGAAQGGGAFSFGGASGGVEAQLEAYSGVGTLFSCVHRISAAASKTDWKLYVKKTDRRRTYGPGTDTRTEVLPGQHPALDLWNQPNPSMTRQRFIETFMQYLLLAGDCEWYCAINESTENMVGGELWPLRPDRCTIYGDELLGRPAGLGYRNGAGQVVPLNLDEFIQLQMANPKNGLRGMSPVAAILTDLGADQAAAAYNAVFFRNNAAPNGVVEVPTSMSDRGFERLQLQFREQNQGVRNAHRVAILDEDAKWKSTTYNMKDMLFPEMREMTSKLVLMAFGMSKTMLGQTEDVNRATAEAALAIFHEQVVDEMNERIRQALNNNFLPKFGDFGTSYEFDFVSAAPEDAEKVNAERTSKVAAWVQLKNAGVDPDEAAKVVGLPPMKMREVQSEENVVGA